MIEVVKDDKSLDFISHWEDKIYPKLWHIAFGFGELTVLNPDRAYEYVNCMLREPFITPGGKTFKVYQSAFDQGVKYQEEMVSNGN